MSSKAPGPNDIRALRGRLGLTQAEAACRALVSLRAWIKYESDTDTREIPAPVWALFRLRSGVISLSDLDREAA